MSEPDLLSEVHPVADLCSHFRTNNALRLIPFEASGTTGSSPLRGHRFLPTSHNTARLSCSNTRMRSAVLSALSCFQCTDNAS
ncbi:hypothetical protein FGAF1140_39300 [Escherichia coli]|nr:hypothetical protein FGAF1140_39300 [Escherichia coli]